MPLRIYSKSILFSDSVRWLEMISNEVKEGIVKGLGKFGLNVGTRMNGVSDFGYFWNWFMRKGTPSLVSQPPKISLVVVYVSASSTPSFGSRNSVESSGDGQCVTVLLRVPLHFPPSNLEGLSSRS
jgi:hypothetical protein